MTTKEKILQTLKAFPDTSISGQHLAEQCNVSRTAIWKAITSLREEGYHIEGTTNGGYIFSNDSDVFSKDTFQTELNFRYPQFSNSYIECHKEIDSTNTHAKRLLTEAGNLRNSAGNLTPAGEKFHNAIIVAESQSAGRGRLGRTFYSPSKTGIYISMIYAPEKGISEPAKLTAFSAVAVCRAIKKLYNANPAIKWINDIFMGGKKVSGILTEGIMNFETARIESAVIGIGINISDNPDKMPEDVKKIAGSITSNLTAPLVSKEIIDNNTNISRDLNDGKENNDCNTSIPTVTRAMLAAEVAGQVLTVLGEDETKVIEEYKSLSFLIGKKIKVYSIIDDPESMYEATAIDIDDKCALVVELSDGSKKALSSGEVSIRSDQLITE